MDRNQARTDSIGRIDLCETGGCLAKLPGLDLEQLLAGARSLAGVPADPANAGIEDAALIETPGGQLLFTVDLGPLVGIDAETAGRIAAYHALSDVYAMAGQPLFALVVLVSDRKVPATVRALAQAGVLAACAEEGVVVVGGHTIEGEEFLIGLAVVGAPHPSHSIIRKKGALPGDAIFISKPLGTSLAIRGIYHGVLGDEALKEAINVMLQSNRTAAEAAVTAGVRALTDVTGFGLLGHLSEMLEYGQGARIELACVPALRSIVDLPLAIGRTRFTDANAAYASRRHDLDVDFNSPTALALLDPQTSGGLLAAAPPMVAGRLREAGFVEIGTVDATGRLVVR